MNITSYTACRSRQRIARAFIAATICAALQTNVATAIPVQIPGDFDPVFSKTSNLAIGIGTDRANANAVQTDGKIVLAGQCVNSVNLDFCLAWFNSDGTLDPSFIGPRAAGAGEFMLPTGGRPGITAPTRSRYKPMARSLSPAAASTGV